MKRITIADDGTIARYELHGETLTMTDTGGCTDALKEHLGTKLRESMADDEIEWLVRDAWCDGYEGDPEENHLSVTVEEAK